MFAKLFAVFATGTGNSYKVAKWISEVAAQAVVSSEFQQNRTGIKWNFTPNSNKCNIPEDHMTDIGKRSAIERETIYNCMRK